MKDKFIVGLVQQSCTNNIEENIEKSVEGIKDASKRGAELVVLQELHKTPYFCQSENVAFFDFAETIPGPSTELFCRIAEERKVVLVISLFEKRAPGVYHNTAVVIEKDGSIVGKYRKMHIPDDPQFYEKFYFTPGDKGFFPIDTSVARLGVQICWDQWFPEAARLLALRGAEILLYPTAIGWTMNDSNDEKKRQFDSWLTIQKSHSVANGIPLLCANRIGLEENPQFNQNKVYENKTEVSPGIQFWGNSFICGSQGEFLAIGSNSLDDVVLAEIDRRRISEVRRIWPFFRDRRIEDYGGILSRYCDEDKNPSDND